MASTGGQEDEAGHSVEELLGRRSREVSELLELQTQAALRHRARRAPLPLGPRSSVGGEARRVADGQVRQLGESPGRHLVSVLLPVKNHAPALRESLPVIFSQSVAARLEVIGIDSGSEDDTIEVLREFDATVLSIAPSDFDHGLTRNVAARHARGDVLLFVSGNARPVNEDWLRPLLAALDEDGAVAGACSRVVTPAVANPLSCRDGELELSGSPVRQRKEIDDWAHYEQLSVDQRRNFLNFHTVSTAIRTEFWERIPFRSMRTGGEDLMWAREVLEAGWALIHEPASLAYHFHDYTLSELFSRNVDDGVANRDVNGRTLDGEEALQRIHSLVRRDWAYLRETLGLEGEELEHWQLEAALRRTAQEAGQWLGINHEQLPEGVAAAFSGLAKARGRSWHD